MQETLPDPPETGLLESEPIHASEPEEIPAEKLSASDPDSVPLTGPESGEKEDLVWKIDGQMPEITQEQSAEPDTEPESPAQEPEAEPTPATETGPAEPTPATETGPAELTQEETGPASPDQGTGILPVPIQILIAAAGIGVCAVGGMAAAGLGPFRKKK